MGHITKNLAHQKKKDDNKAGKKNVLDFIPKGFPSGVNPLRKKTPNARKKSNIIGFKELFWQKRKRLEAWSISLEQEVS